MSAMLEIRRYGGGDRHLHDYSQILFPLQGSMRIAIEGRCDVVSSSAIAVIPERHEHDFEPSRDCCMLVLNVEAAALPDTLPVSMDPVAIGAVAVAGVLISFIATMYPAYVGARLRPAEGLRYE